MDEQQKDLKAYLAHIRSTIAKSESLVSQVELRMAETDRMLERQGLTREQVLAMRFSDAQIEAAKAELRRRGLDPMERWERGDAEPAPAAASGHAAAADGGHPPPDDAELANRQRKLGMMMKPFQV